MKVLFGKLLACCLCVAPSEVYAAEKRVFFSNFLLVHQEHCLLLHG